MTKKQEAFKLAAEERLKSFGRRVTKLPAHIQSLIAKDFSDFEDRINQAYQGCRSKSFERLMDRMEAILIEAEKRWKPSWMYPVIGGISEAEAWFVSDEERASGLMKLGISRGSIWTEAELETIVKAKPNQNFIRAIHQIKTVFDGTLISITDSNQIRVDDPQEVPAENAEPY